MRKEVKKKEDNKKEEQWTSFKEAMMTVIATT